MRAWLASAYSMLCGWAGALQTSFLLGCKRLLDETPAGSWRMRLFSALATGPFRSAILSFYAEVGGAGSASSMMLLARCTCSAAQAMCMLHAAPRAPVQSGSLAGFRPHPAAVLGAGQLQVLQPRCRP